MRIAAGGISHETSTFVDWRTTREDFESGFGLFRGAAVFYFLFAASSPVMFVPSGRRTTASPRWTVSWRRSIAVRFAS